MLAGTLTLHQGCRMFSDPSLLTACLSPAGIMLSSHCQDGTVRNTHYAKQVFLELSLGSPCFIVLAGVSSQREHIKHKAMERMRASDQTMCVCTGTSGRDEPGKQQVDLSTPSRSTLIQSLHSMRSS